MYKRIHKTEERREEEEKERRKGEKKRESIKLHSLFLCFGGSSVLANNNSVISFVWLQCNLFCRAEFLLESKYNKIKRQIEIYCHKRYFFLEFFNFFGKHNFGRSSGVNAICLDGHNKVSL